MIKIIIRHSESIVFGVLFVLIITLMSLGVVDNTLFIGVVGALATIYFGILKIKVENDVLFKELFEKFNSRYDLSLNDLISELRYNEQKSLNQKEINIIVDYFNLCAEEYLWYKKKRIPPDVWNAWMAAIISNLEISKIMEIYKVETNSKIKKASFYGLCEELEVIVSKSSSSILNC